MSGWFISTIFAAFEVGRLMAGTMGGVLASRFGRRAVRWHGLDIALWLLHGLDARRCAKANLTVMGMLFIIARFIQGCGVALAQVAIFAILAAFAPRIGHWDCHLDDRRGLLSALPWAGFFTASAASVCRFWCSGCS